jgi:LysM repeat protein
MTPKMRKFVSLIVVALVLSAAGLTLPAPANAQALCSPFHIVQRNENLYRIGLVYGVPWQILGQLNGIRNPNHIYVGQVICLPAGVPVFPTQPPATPPAVVIPVTPVVPVTPVPPAVHFPAPGTIPSITFNTRNAPIGSTIVITGTNFPGNADVDIFIAPRTPGVPSTYPSTPSGAGRTNPDGTLAVNFTIPAAVGPAPLIGDSFSILVRARGSGYYAFNYVWNR